MKVIFFSVIILFAVAVMELACGSSGFGLPEVFTENSGLSEDPFGGENAEITGTEINPVFRLRLLRTAAAVGVGGALALAGLLLQSVLKNPLADPFVLGISGGAAAGAGMVMLTGLAVLTPFAVSGGAFGGAVVVLLLVMLFSGGVRSGERLLLSGVMTGSLAGAVLMIMTALCNDSRKIAGVSRWMLGDFQAPQVEMLLLLWIALVIGAIIAVRGAKALNVISFDDERAFFLGFDPVKYSRIFAVVAALLTAFSVAVAGIIGFCGLVVPHCVKKVLGTDHRKVVVPVFLWGGIFLGMCDSISSIMPAGVNLPAGVITAAVGAPVFLWILNCRRKI